MPPKKRNKQLAAARAAKKQRSTNQHASGAKTKVKIASVAIPLPAAGTAPRQPLVAVSEPEELEQEHQLGVDLLREALAPLLDSYYGELDEISTEALSSKEFEESNDPSDLSELNLLDMAWADVPLDNQQRLVRTEGGFDLGQVPKGMGCRGQKRERKQYTGNSKRNLRRR
jgi:hypothetical protein